MEKYFMDSCLNYGKKECVDQVKYARFPKPIREGESIPIWPYGEEQRKLDEICEKCGSRYFRIHKKECPVCGSEEFQKEVLGAKITDDKDILRKEIVFMECAGCGTKLQYVIEH